MKKILKIIACSLLLVGCSCNKSTIKLSKGTMPVESDTSAYLYYNFGLLSYELESMSKYDEKITNGDSFFLFVYRKDCYGCKLVSPSLKDYIDENEVAIYTISFEKISTNHDLYKSGINSTPGFVIVRDGKVEYKEVVDTSKISNKKEDIDNWLKNWMDEHIEWGN